MRHQLPFSVFVVSVKGSDSLSSCLLYLLKGNSQRQKWISRILWENFKLKRFYSIPVYWIRENFKQRGKENEIYSIIAYNMWFSYKYLLLWSNSDFSVNVYTTKFKLKRFNCRLVNRRNSRQRGGRMKSALLLHIICCFDIIIMHVNKGIVSKEAII